MSTNRDELNKLTEDIDKLDKQTEDLYKQQYSLKDKRYELIRKIILEEKILSNMKFVPCIWGRNEIRLKAIGDYDFPSELEAMICSWSYHASFDINDMEIQFDDNDFYLIFKNVDSAILFVKDNKLDVVLKDLEKDIKEASDKLNNLTKIKDIFGK